MSAYAVVSVVQSCCIRFYLAGDFLSEGYSLQLDRFSRQLFIEVVIEHRTEDLEFRHFVGVVAAYGNARVAAENAKYPLQVGYCILENQE
jgi:hypothetical protein